MGGIDEYIHALISSVLDGCQLMASHPGRFTPVPVRHLAVLVLVQFDV
jgi:hypothetical protein